MKNITFKVEDKIFEIPANFADIPDFTVTSSLHPYRFIYNDSELPVNQIRKILDEDNENILIADGNVFNLHLTSLLEYSNRTFLINAAEKFKNINTVLELVAFFERSSITKKSDVIVVGGGITQDLSAFACAIYKRGLTWRFFPTTLLSMSDSCIGGKTGLNHNKAKNQLGLFCPPNTVTVNPIFLQTLQEKEIKSGLGEILKLLAIGGPILLERFNSRAQNKHSYKELILGAIRVKKAIIEVDEFENLYRRALNYGHTIGHALEALTDYEIPHGIAIVIGMSVADAINSSYNNILENDFRLLQRLNNSIIQSEELPEFSMDDLANLLRKDKKTSGDTLNFAVLNAPGDMHFLPIPLNPQNTELIKKIIAKVTKQ